jgi:hypothetical protein
VSSASPWVLIVVAALIGLAALVALVWLLFGARDPD